MLFLFLSRIVMPAGGVYTAGEPFPYSHPLSYVKTRILAQSIAKYGSYLLVHSGRAVYFYNPVRMTFDSVVILKKAPRYITVEKKGGSERIVAYFSSKEPRFDGWLYAGVGEFLPRSSSSVEYVGLCGNLPVLRRCAPPEDTVLFGGLKYYLRGDTLMVSYRVDTASRMLIPVRTPGLVSFLSRDTIYTYDGRIMVKSDSGFEQVSEVGIFGYAYRSGDFTVVWNLKDSLYYIDGKSNVVKVQMGQPVGEVRFDLEGRVRWCPGAVDKCRLVYSSPFVAFPSTVDYDGDGQEDILISLPDGRVVFLKGPLMEEYASYSPSTSIYRRFVPAEGLPAVVFYEPERSPFSALLDTVMPIWRDELIFVITHSTADYTTALLERGFGYIMGFFEDLRMVDDRIKFADIVDLPDGRSTLVLNRRDTIAPEIYYRFVIHPRIIYEMPIFENYRQYFIRNRVAGKTVLDVVAADTAVMDAVSHFYDWMHGFMSFGYTTNDLDPVEIYNKAYGSCGEHSILAAALLRTVLIPTYVVADMGEDHQWNEFYDGTRWVHLDVTQPKDRAIDHPIYSSEKLGNKTYVSAVLGVAPEGRFFDVTGHGYTDLGRLVVQVVDTAGNPVPMALVLLRSHWRGGNRPAVWKLTDFEGIADFSVGEIDRGYTVEVFSHYGGGGLSNVMVREGDSTFVRVVILSSVPSALFEEDSARYSAVIMHRNIRFRDAIFTAIPLPGKPRSNPFRGIYMVRDAGRPLPSETAPMGDTLRLSRGYHVLEGRVHQDSPQGADGSWNVLIEVKDTLPFLFFRTWSDEKGLDIDVFLKRLPDGKVIASSGGPDASEQIYRSNLEPGVYLITVKGWRVRGKGLFRAVLEF